MTTVQVEENVKARLTSAKEPVVVCDETGRRFGLFLPDEKDEELYRRARELFTDEEIERARNESGGSTLEEILTRLQKLA